MNTQADKKCPTCGSTYDSSLSYCTKDGQVLVRIDPMIGQLLDGKYRLESVLGRGGMGVVYKATHIHIDTQYAVKVLHPELVANQAAIERFRIEARSAGRIRHPNAIQVTDFGITPERFVYLVMEMVDGVSLRKLLEDVQVLDLHRANDILRQTCAAVDAAHERGVIHRDLKPDNIIVTQSEGSDSVKVLDFGIAKLRDTSTLTRPLSAPLTQAGTLIGTPEYMSPEQCRGLQLDPRSDIYSLGIILYEMLCGTQPFVGDTTLEIVIQQLNNPPRPLRVVDPAIPEEVERVVLRALDKDPAGRQSNSLELSAEFNAAVNAQATGAPRTTVVGVPFAKTDSRKTVSMSDPPVAVPEETRYPTPQTVVGELVSPDSKKQKAIDKRVFAIAAALILGLLIFGGYKLFRKLEISDRGSTPTPTPTRTAVITPPPAGMVLIAGGQFTMGPNSDDREAARVVEIKPFYIDQYEVTNEAYQKFVATGHSQPRGWRNGTYPNGEGRYPVTGVTWQDAQDYATWAGKRLPKEQEWEYVARGGEKEYLFPWGNDWIDGNANVLRSSNWLLAPVGSFRQDRSALGDVFDLAGNVSEWVEDSYQYAPRFKVFRGGNVAEKQLNTQRFYDFPVAPEAGRDRDAYERFTLRKVGFRCAKDASQ